MNILISTNVPWAGSGYGKMGKNLARILKGLGHTIGYAANWGLQGGILDLDDYDIFPLGLGSWGNDIIDQHAKRFGADLVLSVMDVFVLENWGQLLPGKWAAWFPIDGPPANKGDLAKLQTATKAISYSKFGLQELEKAGLRNATYIPPGVDTSIFKPSHDGKSFAEKKRLTKQELGLDPDLFLAVMIAANSSYPDRKCFAENIEAFGRFHARHPKSLLYIHTWLTPQMRGVNLQSITEMLDGSSYVKFPMSYEYHVGYDDKKLAAILNSADVYLGAHGSEGFGIPFIEAMACGTPAILAEGTTGPELNASGWMVPNNHKLWYPLGCWHYRPNIDAIDEALEKSFRMDKDEMGNKVVQFAKDFDWQVLAERYWKPLLESLEPHKPAGLAERLPPAVIISSLVGPPHDNLDKFIQALHKIEYPKEKLSFCFVCHKDSAGKMRKEFPSGNIIVEDEIDPRFSKRVKMEIIFNQLLTGLSNMYHDYVFYTDSDVIHFNPEILVDLITIGAGVAAPMVFYEQGGEHWFYDTVGFVKDGKHFANQPPFFVGYRYHGEPVPIDYAGSCVLIKNEVLKGFVFSFDDLTGFVPICNRARELGQTVMLSQYQSVIHGFLKNPHTLGDWS